MTSTGTYPGPTRLLVAGVCRRCGAGYIADIDASCEYPGRDDALIGYCGRHCWVAAKLAQMPPRRLASGVCRRCGAGYVALSEAEANGSCGQRCTRALDRRNPDTSRGRSRRRLRLRKREQWMLEHLNDLCPHCHKQMITEEWRAKKAAKGATAKYHKPISFYLCPVGYGWHLTSHPRDPAVSES